MSDSEKLEKIFTDRIAKADDALSKTAKLVEIAPLIQQQKEEDEAALELINTFPEDYVTENAPRWLNLEIENDKSILPIIPTLPDVDQASVRFVFDASGTASTYVSSGSNLVAPYLQSSSKLPGWAYQVTVLMDEHAEKLAQRTYLPARLDILNKDLGKKFNIALASFNKSKTGILSVDLAGMHLRDVIDSVWGGLANLARSKNPALQASGKKLERANQADRELVSDSIQTSIFPKTRLVTLLGDMNTLYINLSDRKFGKNPLNKDFPLLKIYFDEWLTIIDGISGLVV